MVSVMNGRSRHHRANNDPGDYEIVPDTRACFRHCSRSWGFIIAACSPRFYRSLVVK